MVTERKRRAARRGPPAGEEVRVNESAGAHNSYGAPDFARGSTMWTPFRCRDCRKDEVWTACQQKWWYEVAKGYVYSTAVRCRACRRKTKSS